jgi:hypothetical protein
MNTSCLLCSTSELKWLFTKKFTYPFVFQREYFHCSTCDLLQSNPESWLGLQEEKTRYETHENDPDNFFYQQYLLKLLNPMLEYISIHTTKGLDYGSGPTKGMESLILKKGGHCESYDPLFYPRQNCELINQFDYILCSEACEHFYNPRQEFNFLNHYLKKNGVLAIRTEFVKDDRKELVQWYYLNDPTHVIFFSTHTWQWLANEMRWSILLDDKKSIVLFKKNTLE